MSPSQTERIRSPALMVLSILHYLFSLFTVYEALPPSLMDVLTLAMIPPECWGNEPIWGISPKEFGYYLIAIILFYTMVKWYLMFNEFKMGHYLANGERYGFCIFIAILDCLLGGLFFVNLSLYGLVGECLGAITLLLLILPPIQNHFYYYFYEDGPPKEKHPMDVESSSLWP